MAMSDGTPFPTRDLAILLASGVILTSLAIASLGLPLLLRGLHLPHDEGAADERDRARIKGAKAAIAEIERVQHRLAEEQGDADRSTEVAARIMAQYRARIDSIAGDEDDRTRQAHEMLLERKLRLTGIRAEREAILGLAREREISVTLAEQLGRELDLADARLTRLGV
jgi:CPA1 family monovalent cation:H+ antiporter